MKKLFALLCLQFAIFAMGSPEAAALTVQNGWFVDKGKAVWGYAQYQLIWTTATAGITRLDPGHVGPDRTEDLDQLTDNMLRYGYPGFDYCFGLWYDRRRDSHDEIRRTDANAQPPFFEQPWARSGSAPAWDGLPQYDLTRFNDWYFNRLKEFARLSDAKGTILFHNYYMQHALLEKVTHYVDFPWRPVNCLQATGMPDGYPAANAFYDVSHDVRRQLHRAYIRKCLDELGGYDNVIHVISSEYTGPLSFMQFWIDEIFAWEKEHGRQVKIGLAATKDVTDAILQDPVRGPRISTIYLSYFWYKANGELFAPPGGQEVRGRLFGGGFLAKETSPPLLHRQILEYRQLYPDKAIVQHLSPSAPDRWPVTRRDLWAFLTAGGSMPIAYLSSPVPNSATYIAPDQARFMLPPYQFIRTHLATALSRMKPSDRLVLNGHDQIWCLADEGRDYLVYASNGGPIQLDLTAAPGASFTAQWLAPATGVLTPVREAPIRGGAVLEFQAPDSQDWALWLHGDPAMPSPGQ